MAAKVTTDAKKLAASTHRASATGAS